MADNNLMTAEQFNDRMAEWGEKVASQAKAVIAANTHSDAPRFRNSSKNKKLEDTIKASVRLGDDGIARWIGFSFIRAGVWVAYGVGRGWVRQNGQLVQGHRVKQGGQLYNQLKKKGYSRKDIGKYVVRSKERKTRVQPRTPLDWLDKVIADNINEVADINAEFFGDAAMRKVLDQFDRMTIRKNYTEIEIR